MLVHESSLKVYLMGRCHSKVIYQKCVFYYKCWKQLLVKRILVKKLLSSLHQPQIKQINAEDYIFFKKFDVLIITVATKSLLYLTPS